MNIFLLNNGVARKCALACMLTLISSFSHAGSMLVESFGFGGDRWDIKQPNTIAEFNQEPIKHGYHFIHYRNPESGHRVNAFVVHNGDHLSVCNPRVDVILPLLRSLVGAYAEQDVAQQVIIESEVQKNLISTCEISFSSGMELKRLFNRAAGYEGMPGLAVNN